jgi:hypothetical protein
VTALDRAEPAWQDEVRAWIDGELARCGLPAVRAIEQVRVWEFSHVLRIDAGTARFYFKARPPGGGAEALLTRRLAERHPASMPDVIAIEPARRWLLMREAPGRPLMDLGDLAPWTRTATAIAEIQITWAGSTGELAALGCPRVSLADVASEIGPLLDDGPALQPGGDASLTDGQIATLRARRAEFEARCRELDALGVPDSIEHGDLWAANVIAGDTTVAILDWEDATVAHPFITPALLLASVPFAPALTDHAAARQRIRDAYLAPWLTRGPAARLERAFDLAQRVALLHYAVQFRRVLPIVRTSRQVREFIPFFLDKLLAP